MSYRIFLLALTFLFASHSSVFAKTIETVVSNGMGVSVQLAAQNAAENALTQVVGSFIDVETQLKKRTEIRDGVVAKTKTISKDINDYSQGSIKYFEILEVTETSGIFKVTARVDVRIDDFKAYIKELAAGEQKVGAGLFGVMKAEKDDEINQASLLVNKIFLPVVRGEVHDVSVGNIMPANRFFEDICPTSNFRTKGGNCNVKKQIRDLSMTVAIPFTISLKKEFVDNALNVLENIGDTKQVFVGTDGLIAGEKGINFLDTSNSQGRAYQIRDLPNKILNYLCNNVDGRRCKTIIQENYRPDVKNKYRDIFTKNPGIYEIWRAGSKNSVDTNSMTYCTVHNDLWFSVFDADGNPLMREVFETCVSEKYENPSTRQPWLSLMYNENYYPVLSLYAAKGMQQSDPILISKRAYVLLITLDENLLARAASMKFEYMQ